MTGPAIAREDLAALLKWYVDNGLDETIGEEAVDRFAAPPPAAASAPEPVIAQRPAAATPIRPATPFPARAPVPLESPPLVEDARALARRPPPPPVPEPPTPPLHA